VNKTIIADKSEKDARRLVLEGVLDIYYGEVVVGDQDLHVMLCQQFGVIRTTDGELHVPDGTCVRITVDKL
jgi:hypothetical protein